MPQYIGHDFIHIAVDDEGCIVILCSVKEGEREGREGRRGKRGRGGEGREGRSGGRGGEEGWEVLRIESMQRSVQLLAEHCSTWVWHVLTILLEAPLQAHQFSALQVAEDYLSPILLR